MTFIKSPNNMVEMNKTNGGNKSLMCWRRRKKEKSSLKNCVNQELIDPRQLFKDAKFLFPFSLYLITSNIYFHSLFESYANTENSDHAYTHISIYFALNQINHNSNISKKPIWKKQKKRKKLRCKQCKCNINRYTIPSPVIVSIVYGKK